MRFIMPIGLALTLSCCVTTIAQTVPSREDPSSAMATASPSVPVTAASPQLSITPSERQYFDLGDNIAHAAFAYAELAKQTSAISKLHVRSNQISQLGDLAPIATRNRGIARDSFVRALVDMRNLNAPSAATKLIWQASTQLNSPLVISKGAKDLAMVNPNAGETLAALDEFERLSSLPENQIIHKWLASAYTSPSGKVWYAEGLIAGLAEIAASEQMPELLPPLSEVATDLRGLRDWLSLRLPDQPTADQTALRTGIDLFLKQTAKVKARDRNVSTLELRALGEISRKLQSQVLDHGQSTSVATMPAG